MKIPVLAPSSDTAPLKSTLEASDVVMDAIFGFSFKGPVRAPFDQALPLITDSKLPIVSVDVPSGWEVDGGRAGGIALEPDVLVSLTSPKEGVREFKGRHFLGGRFVTKWAFSSPISHTWMLTPSDRTMEEKLELNLPEYPDSDQIVEL
jgi:NAD(P)H-hydrate epimerase